MGKKIDHNNFWLIKDNPISKVGIFPYLGKQISPDLEPEKIYQVLRPEEELLSKDAIDSFKLVPLTDEHAMLGPDLTPAEEKGVHGVLGENIYAKDGKLFGDLKIFSESIKEEISNGKKELSLGYWCGYELTPGTWKGQRYDAIQRNIRGNHIALVQNGRIGHDVRVMDKAMTFDSLDIPQNSEFEAIQKKDVNPKQETQTMDKVKEIIRQILALTSKPVSEFPGGEDERTKAIDSLAEGLEAKAEKPAGDTTPPPPKEEKPAAPASTPKAGKDEQKETVKKEEVEEVKKSLDEMPGKFLKMVAERDELFKQLTPIIGTFDHSEMTVTKMAKYACDKLELGVSEDEALPTIKGFLKGRPVAQPFAALDAQVAEDGASEKDPSFDEFLKGGN